MKKERKKESFINKPVFPGGLTAMRKLIRENLKYPEEALEAKIEGSVIVKYDVNYKGKVTKTEITSGLGYGCDEEASRLVKLFQFEVGNHPRRLKVKFHKSIRINFKLPRQKENPISQKQVQVNYTVTKSGEKSKSSDTTYSYTINL